MNVGVRERRLMSGSTGVLGGNTCYRQTGVWRNEGCDACPKIVREWNERVTGKTGVVSW